MRGVVSRTEVLARHRTHHDAPRGDRATPGRHRRAAADEQRHHALPLTADGVPAAIPHAPPPSPVVTVAEPSRAEYPWLPARVIAGSVWRGPAHLRVRVDARGVAAPWPRRPAVPAVR